ncbi:hypothetical protein EDD85DRAFT_792887 [Armillaria nabsnona]|nr:hypothetical protein EDD85DRAFT_792887 [Armillaria nabsnona]
MTFISVTKLALKLKTRDKLTLPDPEALCSSRAHYKYIDQEGRSTQLILILVEPQSNTQGKRWSTSSELWSKSLRSKGVRPITGRKVTIEDDRLQVYKGATKTWCWCCTFVPIIEVELMSIGRTTRKSHQYGSIDHRTLDVYCPSGPCPDVPILILFYGIGFYMGVCTLPALADIIHSNLGPSSPSTGSSPSSPTTTSSTRVYSSMAQLRTRRIPLGCNAEMPLALLEAARSPTLRLLLGIREGDPSFAARSRKGRLSIEDEESWAINMSSILALPELGFPSVPILHPRAKWGFSSSSDQKGEGLWIEADTGSLRLEERWAPNATEVYQGIWVGMTDVGSGLEMSLLLLGLVYSDVIDSAIKLVPNIYVAKKSGGWAVRVELSSRAFLLSSNA